MARARLYRPRILADEHVKARASYLAELERKDAELDIEVLEPAEAEIYVVTLPVDRIVAVVSRLCHANPNDVLSRRRFSYLVMPRQIAMHLCRLYTQRTLPELGRLFHRDHSTIIHANRKVGKMIEGGDPEIRSIVRNAERELLPTNYKGPARHPAHSRAGGLLVSIRRGPRPDANFTIIRNGLLNYPFSAESLGVICYLLSKPDNWQISKKELGSRFKVGRDKINRIINELCEAGYMEKHQPRDESGKLLELVFVCLDERKEPEAVDWKSAPLTEKPLTAEPLTANPHQISTDKKQTTESNKGASEFGVFWAQYPRKVAKPSALKAFSKARKANSFEAIMAGVAKHAAAWDAAGTEKQFIPHPSTFLNQQRFNDESEQPKTAPSRQSRSTYRSPAARRRIPQIPRKRWRAVRSQWGWRNAKSVFWYWRRQWCNRAKCQHRRQILALRSWRMIFATIRSL